jgi:hypothetical protein
MEPGSKKRRLLWTASPRKTSPKFVCKGLDELSTIFKGSTLLLRNGFREPREDGPIEDRGNNSSTE